MPADYEAQVIAVRDALGCLPNDDTTTRATQVYAERDRAWLRLEKIEGLVRARLDAPNRSLYMDRALTEDLAAVFGIPIQRMTVSTSRAKSGTDNGPG